jgi:hypothetical protein
MKGITRMPLLIIMLSSRGDDFVLYHSTGWSSGWRPAHILELVRGWPLRKRSNGVCMEYFPRKRGLFG